VPWELKQLRPTPHDKNQAAVTNTTTTLIALSSDSKQYSKSTSPQRPEHNTAIMFNLAIAALLQLSFFMLAEAAPVSAMGAKPWQAGTGGGIIGFIVLVLDIIAWSKPFSFFERRAF
jgi:hypothetical protein